MNGMSSGARKKKKTFNRLPLFNLTTKSSAASVLEKPLRFLLNKKKKMKEEKNNEYFSFKHTFLLKRNNYHLMVNLMRRARRTMQLKNTVLSVLLLLLFFINIYIFVSHQVRGSGEKKRVFNEKKCRLQHVCETFYVIFKTIDFPISLFAHFSRSHCPVSSSSSLIAL